MGVIIAIVTIWLTIFFEGFMQGLLGASFYAIIAFFLWKRWSLLQYLLVFFLISIALDYINLQMVGATFLILCAVLGFKIVLEKLTQRWDYIGKVITLFFSFTLYNYLHNFIQVYAEGNGVTSLFREFTAISVGGAILMVIVYLLFELLLGFLKPTQDGVIRVR